MPSYFTIGDREDAITFEGRLHTPDGIPELACEWTLDEAEEIGWALLEKVNKLRKALNG